MNRLLDGEVFPGTGPYVISVATADEVRLARNSRFRMWDAAVRPDGFPDEIVFTVVASAAQPISMVERGGADYVALGCCATVSPSERMRLKTQYAGQWHVGTTGTNYVAMNTSIAPFDNLSARLAVNFAIDRGHMAEMVGDDAVTCQLLPPGFPGYRPYCPYTVRPDPGGQWTAPDMQRAQELVNESGTRGALVTVGATGRDLQREYVGTVLEDLGYEVSIDRRDFFTLVHPWDRERTHITINAFGTDYLAPSTFLKLVNCDGDPDNVIQYCNPDFGAAFDHALELQTTDLSRRVERVGSGRSPRGRPRPYGPHVQRRRPFRVGTRRQLSIQSHRYRPVRPDLGSVGRAVPNRRGAPDRFLTTVLMTDIVGSTDHAAELGDSGWRELVQQHHARPRRTTSPRRARARHRRRRLLRVFDAPAAAVRCALEIVDEIKQLGLEVRVGVHVGEVEQIGRKVGGISVVIASRIMSLAGPSEVLFHRPCATWSPARG